MTAKWLRNLKAAGIVFGVLFAVQLITYLIFAQLHMPRAGIRSLVDYEFLEGRRFVVLEPEMWALLSDAHKQGLLREVTRQGQTVYFSTDEVSEEYKQTASGRIIGYKNGVLIRWELERSGLFWMQCKSYLWVSVKGAESHSAYFVWVLGWWVQVKSQGHAMA